MDTLISQDEAEELLEPYLRKLGECLEAGWQAWRRLSNDSPATARALSTRSRASIVADHIRDAAKAAFADVEGVRLTESRGFLTLTIAEQLLVRFKKMSRSLKTSSVPTNQQLRFSYQLPLEGFPQLTNATAGYVLDPLATSIEQMVVTCTIGKHREWVLAVPMPAKAEVVAFPAPTEVPAGPKIRSTQQPGEKADERKSDVS